MPSKYMTIAHPKEIDLNIQNGKLVGRVPVHDLMANYHWVRLDDKHILLYGTHPLSSHKALHEHPATVVLPFLHHRKTIKDHYTTKDNMEHYHALAKNLTLDEDATMQEFIEAAIERYGPVFAPRI